MIQIRVFLVSFIFLFVSQIAQAQVDNKIKSEPKMVQQDIHSDKQLNDRWNNALGSFQFQIINSRINPQIPISTIELIEENRLEDKVNYINYKQDIRLMILPKSALKKEYQKLDLFKYISSN